MKNQIFKLFSRFLTYALVTLSMAFVLFENTAWAVRPITADQYFEKYMELFDKSPAKALRLMPAKFNKNGEKLNSDPLFNVDEIKKRDYVLQKSLLRKKLMGTTRPMMGFEGNNLPESFFNRTNILLKKTTELNSQFNTGKSTLAPWSSDYWATYQGGIGARYNSADYPRTSDYKDYSDFHEKNKNINFESQEALDNLSPSEKYDIVMGDFDFSLTRWSWADAERTYLANDKKIESWFGICHGWAPAAYMMSRPLSSVEVPVTLMDGKTIKIKFYPDDLKALSSLLWANWKGFSYYLGGRCNEKNPKTDTIGRITNSECFDVNPGSWHIVLLNQMGAQKNSFIIDATYDYEVWNQPVHSYSLRYFNPQTRKFSEVLTDAMIPTEEYQKDKFKKYRNGKTKFIVGVNLELTYTVETSASHKETDAEQDDITNKVQYIYDLEIDENNQIIGGEWYHNAHPDFIWTPPNLTRAISWGDQLLRTPWDFNSKTPSDWTFASKMSAMEGQPLATAVELLINKANNKQ